jgi:hypothetical protein
MRITSLEEVWVEREVNHLKTKIVAALDWGIVAGRSDTMRRPMCLSGLGDTAKTVLSILFNCGEEA